MSFNKFRIFLSASVPDQSQEQIYSAIPAQLQIEEAVISLARAVFAHKGQLVFGGHPSITRIIASIANEFDLDNGIEDIKENKAAARPLVLYQSKIFCGKTPPEVEILEKQGYTEINWVDMASGEVYDPGKPRGKDYPKSMEALRNKMFGSPFNAMVCIGGMKGVRDEVDLFTGFHPEKKIYLLPSTGGASKLMAGEYSSKANIKNEKNFKIFDTSIFEEYRNDFIKELNQGNNAGTNEKIEFNYDPYGFLAALIVEDIITRQ